MRKYLKNPQSQSFWICTTFACYIYRHCECASMYDPRTCFFCIKIQHCVCSISRLVNKLQYYALSTTPVTASSICFDLSQLSQFEFDETKSEMRDYESGRGDRGYPSVCFEYKTAFERYLVLKYWENNFTYLKQIENIYFSELTKDFLSHNSATQYPSKGFLH